VVAIIHTMLVYLIPEHQVMLATKSQEIMALLSVV